MSNQPRSEQLSYDFVMNEAVKQNDNVAINQLTRIGRPPYTEKTSREMADACDTERFIVEKYAPSKNNIGFFKIIKGVLLDRE